MLSGHDPECINKLTFLGAFLSTNQVEIVLLDEVLIELDKQHERGAQGGLLTPGVTVLVRAKCKRVVGVGMNN